MTLAGRVALVTGASQGIGRACALKLAQSGATLALAARSQEKLQEVAAEIAAAGGTATCFPSGRQRRGTDQGHLQDRHRPAGQD